MKEKFSILKLVQKVPGGMMIIPLILGALCNSFIPQAIEIGGFTTDLLKNGVNAFVAMFFVCSGSQIKLREAATPLVRGTVLCAAKIAIGAIIGLVVAKVWGMNGVLGLSPLALVSAITNSSGTLYVSLAQEFGDKNDVAAIGPLCINDLPFVTMVVFGAAGLAEIPIMSLIASLFPLILGIILGNIDENIRKFLAPGCNVIIPFVALRAGREPALPVPAHRQHERHPARHHHRRHHRPRRLLRLRPDQQGPSPRRRRGHRLLRRHLLCHPDVRRLRRREPDALRGRGDRRLHRRDAAHRHTLPHLCLHA